MADDTDDGRVSSEDFDNLYDGMTNLEQRAWVVSQATISLYTSMKACGPEGKIKRIIDSFGLVFFIFRDPFFPPTYEAKVLRIFWECHCKAEKHISKTPNSSTKIRQTSP